MTKKATQRYLSKTNHKPFVHKGQAIEVFMQDKKLVLGDTFVVNLLFDNLTPSALVNRYATLR